MNANTVQNTEQGSENKGREMLIRIKEKSEDDYEKNITYISAGTLVLSLTFIEKIVSLEKSKAIGVLICSWLLLALTLLANLISHQLSSHYHDKTIGDLDCGNENLQVNVLRRNKVIKSINWGTTFSLFFGILLIIIFCSINLCNMATPEIKTTNVDGNDLEKKGRTITPPSTGANSTSTTTQQGGKNSNDGKKK